jgi:hypothetical protein
MGLGIVAGSKAYFVTADLDTEYIEPRNVFVIGPDYPERLDGLPEGVYHINGDVLQFSVGPYSKYNSWRAQLAELVFGVPPEVIWEDPDAYTGKPFVELIDFSDNEGAIGPTTSRKLVGDFDEYAENLENQVGKSETGLEFMEIYSNFRRAFQLASDEGFVVLS